MMVQVMTAVDLPSLMIRTLFVLARLAKDPDIIAWTEQTERMHQPETSTSDLLLRHKSVLLHTQIMTETDTITEALPSLMTRTQSVLVKSERDPATTVLTGSMERMPPLQTSTLDQFLRPRPVDHLTQIMMELDMITEDSLNHMIRTQFVLERLEKDQVTTA